MGCEVVHRIKKAVKNPVGFRSQEDLTGKTVQFRVKKRKEDETDPLIEGVATISEDGRQGYFVVDLSSSPELQTLSGEAFIDFKVIDPENPDIPSYSWIYKLQIETTLKP